jgi:hypothetical protein
MAIQSKSKDKLLVFKDKISTEATTGLTAIDITIPAAQATVPCYNERGDLLGHLALFDTADLT